MRGKKRSVSEVAEPIEPANVAPRERWQEIDERLRACARGVLDAFLDFVTAVGEANEEKVWERFGYTDPEPYFTDRIGIAPRTFRRYLRIHGMLASLPAATRGAAMDKIDRIGANKADIIAGIVEHNPGSFDDWVENAQHMTR